MKINESTDSAPYKKVGGKAVKERLRLDKRLALEGHGTRSEIRKAVRAGRVSVNGQTEKDPGRQISLEDKIFFDGERVGREAFVYYMLNKPAGVITATEDAAQRTVLDLLRDPLTEETEPVRRRGIFPVGRLDLDTEGLLLMTDDGQLAHRLLAPRRHVDKVYYALVSGKVTEEDVRLFSGGMQVGAEGTQDAFRALPAELRIVGFPGDDSPEGTEQELLDLLPMDPGKYISPETLEYTQIFVTIREGKYHQIKRMFAATGKKVLYLKRVSMGKLRLDPALGPGHFRKLTEEEVRQLQE